MGPGSGSWSSTTMQCAGSWRAGKDKRAALARTMVFSRGPTDNQRVCLAPVRLPHELRSRFFQDAFCPRIERSSRRYPLGRRRERHARPGEGPTGAFAFGRARGVIEGVLATAGIPCQFLTPPSWKRAIGLTLASKDAARSEAIRRWPICPRQRRRRGGSVLNCDCRADAVADLSHLIAIRPVPQ